MPQGQRSSLARASGGVIETPVLDGASTPAKCAALAWAGTLLDIKQLDMEMLITATIGTGCGGAHARAPSSGLPRLVSGTRAPSFPIYGVGQ